MAKRCRAFRFLLQPTTKQRALLERLLDSQCELYNAALEERRGAWCWEQRTVTKYEQFGGLAGLRELRPDALAFGTTVCRGTLTRLDEAFRAFYRRTRAGEKAGYPRFKGAHRWDSAQWPYQAGWKLEEQTQRLRLHGIGAIRFRRNRALRGRPKTITVRREGRRWFVTVFCVDVPAEPIVATGRGIGVDLGVHHLATTSDGHRIPNLRVRARTESRLLAAQRDLSRKKHQGANRRKAAQHLGSIHRKVARQRLDHAHKVSRALVRDNDVIVHERLRITNLCRRPPPRPDGDGHFAANGAAQKAGLNKSILDAGWGLLLRLVTYKAEDAGRTVIAVAPRQTSQRCHACGHSDRGNRCGPVFRCQRCGHVDDADRNAARNILRAGLAQWDFSHGAEEARSKSAPSSAGP